MPGIPANITIEGRTPATIKGNLPPLINTASAARGGFRAGDDAGGGSDPVGVIFADNFDDQPDWIGQVEINGTYVQNPTLPTGWDAFRSVGARYAPSKGDMDKHETIEIVGGVGSGGGKCLVKWRDSSTEANAGVWKSDGILSKFLPDGLSEVYCKYGLELQPGWTADASTWAKAFRFSSLKAGFGEWNFGTGSDDGHGPMLFHDIIYSSTWGLSNDISMRGFPNTNNYRFETSGVPSGLPRTWNYAQLPCNFTDNVTDLNNDGTDTNPPYISKVTGLAMSGKAEVAAAYGFGEINTFEHYVKMNSAPGVADGIYKQWINGFLTFFNSSIAWVGPGVVGDMPTWNRVQLGGNDHFPVHDESLKHEEWSAYHFIEIRDSLPENRL